VVHSAAGIVLAVFARTARSLQNFAYGSHLFSLALLLLSPRFLFVMLFPYHYLSRPSFLVSTFDSPEASPLLPLIAWSSYSLFLMIVQSSLWRLIDRGRFLNRPQDPQRTRISYCEARPPSLIRGSSSTLEHPPPAETPSLRLGGGVFPFRPTTAVTIFF